MDFAIEAVPEAIELKQMLFSELDDLCPSPDDLRVEHLLALDHPDRPGDRAAATGSSASISSIPSRRCPWSRSSAARRPPPRPRGGRSSSSTLSARRPSGSTTRPGFATSRLGVALGLEAMRMIEEGVSSADDIDRAMELGYGHRMGPLKTTDLVGLDVRLAIAETLAAELPSERFTPPEILKTLVAEGRTGEEGGRRVLPLGRRQGRRRRRRAPRSSRRSDERAGSARTEHRRRAGGRSASSFFSAASSTSRGPGPILLLIGAILFTFSALRGFRGPVVPAGVLLGLGAGFLLRDPLDPWMPRWATILLVLGGGLLLAAGIDRQGGPGAASLDARAGNRPRRDRGGGGPRDELPRSRERVRRGLALVALGSGPGWRGPGRPGVQTEVRHLDRTNLPVFRGATRPPKADPVRGNARAKHRVIVSRRRGGGGSRRGSETRSAGSGRRSSAHPREPPAGAR